MQAPGEIKARAGVGGNRRLRLHVLGRFREHVHFSTGRSLECRNHGVERIVFRRHEALPAHHGKLGARLRLPLRRLRPGLGEIEQSWPGQRAGRGQCGTALKKRAASKVVHSPSSLEYFLVIAQPFSRLPVVSSNRCTSDGSGLSRILSPGLNSWRSRNTATTCSPPILANTWVSQPVGSTTRIPPSAPTSSMRKRLDRTP